MATAPNPASKPPVGKGPRPRTLRDDFPYIRSATIAFGTSVLLATAMVVGSNYLLSLEQASKKRAESAGREARNKTSQLENDSRDIKEYQPRYLDLMKGGLVGEEKRLDWIEHVRQIQSSRKLLPLTYEVAPQSVFQVDAAVTGSDIELRGSRIQVQMALMHEMDWLNFLNDLKTRGHFVPQSCTIKAETASSTGLAAPRLSADCTLFWVTLRSRAAQAAELAKAEAERAEAAKAEAARLEAAAKEAGR